MDQAGSQQSIAAVVPPVVPPLLQVIPSNPHNMELAGTQQSKLSAVVPPVTAVPPVAPVAPVPVVVQVSPNISIMAANAGSEQSVKIIIQARSKQRSSKF